MQPGEGLFDLKTAANTLEQLVDALFFHHGARRAKKEGDPLFGELLGSLFCDSRCPRWSLSGRSGAMISPRAKNFLNFRTSSLNQHS